MPLLLAAAASAVDFDTTFPEDANKEAVIRHLRPALEPIDGAARVYAVVDCRGLPATRFPRVMLQTPRKAKTGINAVREIFAKDKQTTVTLDPMGMPRIRIGKAPSALLQTKIHRLRFTPQERYNIISAELALEKTKEIQTAVRRLNLKQPLTVISENVQVPMEDVPRLPASIKDVTFDQALDLLAATFVSVIFYEECTDGKEGHFFSIDHGCIVCGPWRNTQEGTKRANMNLR
jgi:hypothetical protein